MEYKNVLYVIVWELNVFLHVRKHHRLYSISLRGVARYSTILTRRSSEGYWIVWLWLICTGPKTYLCTPTYIHTNMYTIYLQIYVQLIVITFILKDFQLYLNDPTLQCTSSRSIKHTFCGWIVANVFYLPSDIYVDRDSL